MVEGLTCGSADESTGMGCPSTTGSSTAITYINVLHRGCGECAVFQTSDGTKVGAIVMNVCPNSGNAEWCGMDGQKSTNGYYNHFDFLYGTDETTVTDVIGDNPVGSVWAIECPSDLITDMTTVFKKQNSLLQEVCTFYDTATSAQGCPGMDVFGCTTCS